MAGKKERVNPFAPGSGMMPAYFAGRKVETKEIETVLDRAKSAYKPKSGETIVVGPLLALVGPRGIGKTLLLSIASRMATRKKIQVVELTEADINPGLADVLELILPEGKFEAFFKKHRSKIKGKVSDHLGAEVQPYSGESKLVIHKAISERLKKGPLLISIDEAHALSDEFLRAFYQQTQKLMRNEQPLAVIMAGTPSIKRHRRRKGLTFAERVDFLEFNLLSDAETQDAFVNAFLSMGMTIEPGALERLTSWSDNYPYFVQMAGYCTWNCIEHTSNKSIITEEDVNSGIRQATEKRDSFYEERVGELRDESIYKEAMHVVRLFKNSKGSMNTNTFIKKMLAVSKNLDEDSVLALEKSFLELGFLYKKAAQLSPGIPSLFSYMEKNHGES